jgi:hypothetical protein
VKLLHQRSALAASTPAAPAASPLRWLAALGDVPQFVVATHRALALGIAPGSFLLPEGAPARRGAILAEGPDSPVAAVAAFTVAGEGEGGEEGAAAPPPPPRELLAVALRGGALPIWDPSTRSLLLVRELPLGGKRRGFGEFYFSH